MDIGAALMFSPFFLFGSNQEGHRQAASGEGGLEERAAKISLRKGVSNRFLGTKKNVSG
jgi:hypothetical protein